MRPINYSIYNKYKTSSPEKRTIDGITFASKMEADRYRKLKLLEKAKKIKDLVLQPKYELQEAFEKNGKKYMAINYVADFKYFDLEKKKEIIEDVKGFETPVFTLKRKMFEYKYPDKEITIV